MKIIEGIEHLTAAMIGRGNNLKLVIPVRRSGVNMGGTPCVEVASIEAGFDWNNGKVMIEPAEPLISVANARKQRQALIEALELIADIGEGSTTANSLPNIAKIARAAVAESRGDV